MIKSGVILSPIVSEKSFRLAAAGQFTFRVDPRATAPTIAAAIAKIYGVTVTAIRTAHQAGKRTRYKGRAGSRSNVKKAIVTLKAGQRIAGFEVEQSKEKASDKAIERQSDTGTTPSTPKISKKTGVTTTVRTPKPTAEAKESK